MKKSLIICAWTLLLACGDPTVKEKAAESPLNENQVTLDTAQIRLAGIDTGRAVVTRVSSTLEVNGVVDVPPQNIVSVSFPLGGFLKSSHLLPGMQVKKGEVIGVMEDPSLVQLQQDYLVTREKLHYLKLELDRQQILSENKINAEKQLQLTRADYQSQLVLLKGYGEKLKLIGINGESLTEANLSGAVNLRSPINGYVAKVNVNRGKYVNPTDVLFELINPNDLHAALTVFEKDMGKIRIGQEVRIRLVDEPGTELPGEIIVFSHNVDENRSGTVHCHFETAPKHLMPGMFLNATILLEKQPALTVPETAVVRFGGNQYVFTALEGNRFEWVEVQVRNLGEGKVAISSENQDLGNRPLVLSNAYAVLGAMKNKAEE